MSFWSRWAGRFRADRWSREIDEELQGHLAEAVAHGREPAEARRAFGSPLRHREASLDVRLFAWFASLRADAVFGWRRLLQSKVASGAAILSLALATGACTSAFRLIDALLLRPLPVSHPERLYSVAFQGIGADGLTFTYDSCSYPMFLRLRAAARDQAESVAVSYAERIDLTYGGGEEMEKAWLQFVSGWMFQAFGLEPALGRLLAPFDDDAPGQHPVAVLSYDYWTRRFARDPGIVGRSFRMGDGLYRIVGVAGPRFTGTETGTVTDVFLPMAMKTPRTLASATNFWLRTLVQLKPGASPFGVRERLRAAFAAIQQERAAGFMGMTPNRLQQFLRQQLLLESAASGRSNLQRDYGRSLLALAILVLLVLLIACANVANLLAAQASARAREMALRVAIGAGRRRLVQLVLVECAWLALLSTALGSLFAWRAAPFLVGMINPPDNPARLALPADWRVAAFSLALACAITFLFGLAPALRASAVRPIAALRGGSSPRSRRRTMQALIVLQVAFCFVVLFVAGLFAATFDRLIGRPTGFSAERLLNLEAVAPRPQSPLYWQQAAGRLASVPGVERVSLTIWPVMSGESAIGNISIGGAPPSEVYADFLRVSPGWLETMRIPLLNGRDFRPGDAGPSVAIVNRAFAAQFFDGADPVGKSFENDHLRVQIVGLVPDARSRDDLRRPIRPTAYFPFQTVDAQGAPAPMGRATFVVRTRTPNPMALASLLRREVPRIGPAIYVSNIRTQQEINLARTVRERLLALLAMFFAAVAVLLAGIGLYGVLDYGVLAQRREIGIRRAVGAQAAHIARGVAIEALRMVCLGAAAGTAFGFVCVRYIETLLYEVKGTEAGMLLLPCLLLVAAAALAALPAVLRAVRIDPVEMLRAA